MDLPRQLQSLALTVVLLAIAAAIVFNPLTSPLPQDFFAKDVSQSAIVDQLSKRHEYGSLGMQMHEGWHVDYSSSINTDNQSYPFYHAFSRHRVIRASDQEVVIGWEWHGVNISETPYTVRVDYQLEDRFYFPVAQSSSTTEAAKQSAFKIKGRITVSRDDYELLGIPTWKISYTIPGARGPAVKDRLGALIALADKLYADGNLPDYTEPYFRLFSDNTLPEYATLPIWSFARAIATEGKVAAWVENDVSTAKDAKE